MSFSLEREDSITVRRNIARSSPARKFLRSGTQRLAPFAMALFAMGCTSGGSGLSVWMASDTAPVALDAPPAPENEVYSAARQRARLVAARGETVAVQLAMRTLAPPAGPFDVRVTDLTGPEAQLSASESVRIYRVAPTRVEQFASWYPAHAQRPALPRSVPDVLVPWGAPRGGGPVRLDTAQTQSVWIDIDIPRDLPPGEYSGRVELVDASAGAALLGTNGAARYGAELRVLVAPIEIPAQRSLPVVARVDPRGLLEGLPGFGRSSAPEELRLVTDSGPHASAIQRIQGAMSLLHAHRLNPVLWAAFPKYRLSDGPAQVDWDSYDALVGPWLSGEGFADGVGLAVWPMPVSMNHPSAQANGGLDSPRYARLLASYLRACETHFAERGWSERAFLRPQRPGELSEALIRDADRIAGIRAESGVQTPLLAHLPPSSLAGFGWVGAPGGLPSEINMWAPPASWLEPAGARQRQTMGARVWMMPDHPPYSGSLRPEAPANDPTLLPWLAYRYDLDGLWIENAAPAAEQASGEADRESPLIYSGEPYGLEEPVPTARLKRLRSGLFDYERLKLLEAGGRRLLARRTAEQMAPRGALDAAGENLISTRPASWSSDPYSLWLARRLLMQELLGPATAEAPVIPQEPLLANLADWERLLAASAAPSIESFGVRISESDPLLRLTAFVACQASGEDPRVEAWSSPSPPEGWNVLEVVERESGRSAATLECELQTLGWNADGVFNFEVACSTANAGVLVRPLRLAVAGCPRVEQKPRIDGDLSDWRQDAANSASDFRLVRGRSTAPGTGPDDAPLLPTRAYFCMDDENFYVGVLCRLRPGEGPRYENDNAVPIDGAIPWGQDLIEILLSPQNVVQGAPGDLYLLQIKPSGVVVAQRGPRTDPPIAKSVPWQAQAQVAARVSRDAWVSEVRVPLSALGDAAQRNRIWGVNVTRLDARRGEYSSWSGARDHCYLPQRLGNLLLVEE